MKTFFFCKNSSILYKYSSILYLNYFFFFDYFIFSKFFIVNLIKQRYNKEASRNFIIIMQQHLRMLFFNKKFLNNSNYAAISELVHISQQSSLTLLRSNFLNKNIFKFSIFLFKAIQSGGNCLFFTIQSFLKFEINILNFYFFQNKYISIFFQSYLSKINFKKTEHIAIVAKILKRAGISLFLSFDIGSLDRYTDAFKNYNITVISVTSILNSFVSSQQYFTIFYFNNLIKYLFFFFFCDLILLNKQNYINNLLRSILKI